jgi:hypothetical protein
MSLERPLRKTNREGNIEESALGIDQALPSFFILGIE